MFTFKYFKIPRTLSRDYCRKALQALEKVVKKPQKGIIHLIVIDTAEMARMNEQFRGKSGPTDILTFSYLEETQSSKFKVQKGGDFKKPGKVPTTKYQLLNTHVAGEIYLCLEKIKLYAKERGVTYREQLEHIIIHGLVHLMGYDHETEEGAREMEAVEELVLSAIS